MRKYKNEKNHDIIEDKTDEMDDVHLDIDELDEILDDFEPGNITPKHTPKQKKKRRLLLIIFCVLLVVTGVVVTMAVLSTNVYQDDAEFKSYADKQFREDKLFEINGKTEKVYEYGSPISYAADYDVIDNESVNAFRQKQIDRITADYKAAPGVCRSTACRRK